MARTAVPRAQNLWGNSDPNGYSLLNATKADQGGLVTRVTESLGGGSLRHILYKSENPFTGVPGEYTFSVDAASTNRWLALVIEGSVNSTLYQYFNLVTGAIGSSGSGGDLQAKIGVFTPRCTLLPNGKYRCSVGVTLTRTGIVTHEYAMATANGATPYPAYVGDGASYIDISNPNFSKGDTLDVHATTGVADAVAAAARSRVSQYQNLVFPSEDINSWTKQANVVVTPDQVLNPFGTAVDADLVDVTAAAVNLGVLVTGVGNGVVGRQGTRSVWLKGVLGTEIVTLRDPSATVGTTTCALTTSWQRFSLTEPWVTSSNGIWIRKSSGNQFYAWGGHIYEGLDSGGRGYIKTTTAFLEG